MSLGELLNYKQQLNAEGKTTGNSKEAAKVWHLIHDHPAWPLVSTLKNEIVSLDRQLDELGPLSLTDEEKQAFLERAIELVTPYFNKKEAEYQKRLEEGEIQTAFDTLDDIRDIEQETRELLADFDLSTAETEEEFANRLGALTAQTEDQIEEKQRYWAQAIENEKRNQIQRGIFSSGIGKKERDRLAQQREMQLGNIQERAQEQQTELETTKKYNLENIRLAREAAQQRRINAIGTPEERLQTEQKALSTLGYENMGQLPSDVAWEQRTGTLGYTPLYNKSVLSDLEEERLKSVESRKQELQAGELGRREQEYEQRRKKLLADRAEKASKLNKYGVYI